MMYNIKFIDRFSYSKTSEFWQCIDIMLSKSTENSLTYSVILRDRAMFLLSYSYGLRPEEIINLNITDLNFDCNDTIESILIAGKDKSRLIYPVFPEVMDAVRLFVKLISASPDKRINNYLFHKKIIICRCWT